MQLHDEFFLTPGTSTRGAGESRTAPDMWLAEKKCNPVIQSYDWVTECWEAGLQTEPTVSWAGTVGLYFNIFDSETHIKASFRSETSSSLL